MKMKILVVEDNELNIAAAKKMLAADHDLTIISGYDQAHQMLKFQLNAAKAAAMIEQHPKFPAGWVCKVEEEDGTIAPEVYDENGKHVSLYNDSIRAIWEEVEAESLEVPFDVVLTDVMIPKGGDACMSLGGRALARRQGEMPYGPIIALRAIQAGMKRVGIITQGSHHDDPFVYAFDNLAGFSSGDIKVVCENCMEVEVDTETWQQYSSKDWDSTAYKQRVQAGKVAFVKDWGRLLEKLIG